MGSDTEQLLRQLTAGDEQCLRWVLSPTADSPERHPAAGHALDRRVRALVQLGALIAVGAPTTSLCWAVEQACSNGAEAEAVVEVLVATAGAAGAAQVVSSAPRLALALGLDMELEGWDGS